MSPDLSTPLYLSYAALWLLVLLQGLILLGVVRIVSQLQINKRAASPGLRGEAPAFTALDLSGRLIDTKDFAGRLAALLFASPRCSACAEGVADIEYVSHELGGKVVVICQGQREECSRFAEEQGIDVPVVADHDNRISDLYNATAVPMLYVIDADNQVQAFGRVPRHRLDAFFGRVPSEATTSEAAA